MTDTLVSKSPLNTNRLHVGSYLTTTTAAAKKITTGFRPRYVKVWNETSGDVLEWNETMADAEGFKRVTAGTSAMVVTLGITPAADGFTIGLDTDINVINEQMSYIAIG